MIRWLGQEQAKTPEQAAGQAAKDRAEKSSWPPTQADFEGVGAAAGAAAGAVICAETGPGATLCATAGTVIGGAIGAAVFALGDAIASGLDAGRNPTAEYLVELRKTLNKIHETAENLAKRCGTSREQEFVALNRWGLKDLNPDGSLPARWRSKPLDYGVPAANEALVGLQKRLFAAASARAAECETKKTLASKKASSSVPVVVAGTVVLGIVAWLLFAA